MRQIKFRGKDLDGAGWVYGYLVKEVCCDVWIFPHDDTYCNAGGDWYYRKRPGFCIVDPETVGQFTGLKDKNGKEIYEGDVVETITNGYRYVQEVVWSDIETGFSFRGHGCGPLFHESSCMEVIGNIHDNPELLK